MKKAILCLVFMCLVGSVYATDLGDIQREYNRLAQENQQLTQKLQENQVKMYKLQGIAEWISTLAKFKELPVSDVTGGE